MGGACPGRGRHAQSAPTIVAACPASLSRPCLFNSAATHCPGQRSTPRSLPLTPPRSTPRLSRVRHGRAGRAPVPPLLPLLQPSCACTELSIGGTWDCTSSLTSPPSLQAAGAPSPPVKAGSSHRSPWPGSHEPPPAVQRTPVGARKPGAAAAPLLCRRRAPQWPESRAPASSSALLGQRRRGGPRARRETSPGGFLQNRRLK